MKGWRAGVLETRRLGGPKEKEKEREKENEEEEERGCSAMKEPDKPHNSDTSDAHFPPSVDFALCRAECSSLNLRSRISSSPFACRLYSIRDTKRTQLQHKNPAQESSQSLESSPMPHRFSPRIPTSPPVVPYTPQIHPQNPYRPFRCPTYLTDSTPEALQILIPAKD